MKRLALATAVCAALILSCTNGKSPFSNPADAKIVPQMSLHSLDAVNDSVRVNTALQCTVQVYLPNLIDSFYVHSGTGGADSIIASGAVTGVSFSFSFSEKAAGDYALVVVIVKADKSVDSLKRTVTVYAMSPVVTPDSAAIHVVLPADSVVVTFTVTDPDSNVWMADTWLDSATALMQETSFAPKTHRAVISRTVKKPALLAALKAPVVCYAAAIDFDSNMSRTAACTLYVKDTVVPQIRLLPPTDTVNAVSSPVTIMALVTSAVGIDSVLFNNTRMVYNNDTALHIASLLDTGRTPDSIVAIDQAGNRGSLRFSLHVQGTPHLPPLIRSLIWTKPQGKPFAPIFLDTCVTIADTSIKDTTSYKKDSLTWLITDSSNATLPIDPGHIFRIPFPADTMWVGTINLTFKLLNAKTYQLYATAQPTIFVSVFNYPPVITFPSGQCFSGFRTDTIYLDTITTAHDPNDALSSLSWSFSNGKHFKVDSLKSPRLLKASESAALIPFPEFFNRHIMIDTVSAADTAFDGTDTITFTVTDPGGLQAAKKIGFNRPCLFHFP